MPFVQIDRNQADVVGARKNAQIQHDFPDPLRAFPATGDQLSQDVQGIEGFLIARIAPTTGRAVGNALAGVVFERRRQVLGIFFDKFQIAVNVAGGIVQFVGDAGHQQSERRHFFRLHQLLLGVGQVPVSGFELLVALAEFLVGGGQVLGAFGDFRFQIAVDAFQQATAVAFGGQRPQQQMAAVDQRPGS